MTTRGIIAVPYGDAWRGRYNHSDSYPHYLGSELFRIHSEVFAGDTVRMRRVLTEDHTEWSFAMGDWSQSPRFYDLAVESGVPRCYCHGGDGRDVWLGPDEPGVEFCYVVHDEGLEVLACADESWQRLGLLPWGLPADVAESVLEAWGWAQYPRIHASVAPRGWPGRGHVGAGDSETISSALRAAADQYGPDAADGDVLRQCVASLPGGRRPVPRVLRPRDLGGQPRRGRAAARLRTGRGGPRDRRCPGTAHPSTHSDENQSERRMQMSTAERAWWLAGACDMADMGASLLVDTPNGRLTLSALDTCKVEDGVLRCGEAGMNLLVNDLLVLAFRQDEQSPWLALETDAG